MSITMNALQIKSFDTPDERVADIEFESAGQFGVPAG
ncbi:hypothetical protein SAMN05216281_11462 [Cryobacterium luteum]|nr:hypothetical protein SAMN05216281_11462 [Cryobacterium luteum]